MAQLEVRGVRGGYGDVTVLKDVSLEVHDREVVALVGANGAGKSTLLRTISGLLRPMGGEIHFNGERIDHAAPHHVVELGFVQVPEGKQLFPQMTVEENLIMGSLHGEAKGRRFETMERVYTIFPRLRERRRQLAGTMSGGEQQMLAVGRGLMSLPKIMMFDEPSLGLSPILVSEIFRMIRMVNAEGVTVMLVEQNVKQTLAMCHRAYVLENGRIIMQGTGSELLADEKVKEAFLGL